MNRRIGDSKVVTRRSFQLRIRSIEPENHMLVKRGESGQMQVVIKNGFLSEPNVIVSLGQGIDTRILSVKPDRRYCTSKLILAYRVEAQAESGERDLLIQFNRIFLDQRDVLWVLDEHVAEFMR